MTEAFPTEAELRALIAQWRKDATRLNSYGSPNNRMAKLGLFLSVCADDLELLMIAASARLDGPFPISDPTMTWDEAIARNAKENDTSSPSGKP